MSRQLSLPAVSHDAVEDLGFVRATLLGQSDDHDPIMFASVPEPLGTTEQWVDK
jgi:hypothetical protein